jgi:2-amino-4-hydroxy-6-hydroxymethyldihydropteridine diphosphokinase
VRVVIGLGSNLGERLEHLRAAVRGLGRSGRIVRVSRLYETAPMGPPQPRYLNAAVLLETDVDPVALLDALLALEAEGGRVRGDTWGPRTIDLDILWIEGRPVDDPRLVVPHPRLTERAFALIPMLEVVPDAVDPRTGRGFTPPEVEAGAIDLQAATL